MTKRLKKILLYFVGLLVTMYLIFSIALFRHVQPEEEVIRTFLVENSQISLTQLKSFIQSTNKFDTVYEIKLPDGNWVYFAYRHIEGDIGCKSKTFIFCSNGEWYSTPFGFLGGELPTYLQNRRIKGMNDKTKGSISNSGDLKIAISRIKALKKIKKCGDFNSRN